MKNRHILFINLIILYNKKLYRSLIVLNLENFIEADD